MQRAYSSFHPYPLVMKADQMFKLSLEFRNLIIPMSRIASMAFLLHKQIKCSASTASVAMSCAMQHHFLNSTSITIPRFVDPTQLYMMLQSTTVSFNASSLLSERKGSLRNEVGLLTMDLYHTSEKGESILLHNPTHQKETCPHTGTSESTLICVGGHCC